MGIAWFFIHGIAKQCGIRPLDIYKTYWIAGRITKPFKKARERQQQMAKGVFIEFKR